MRFIPVVVGIALALTGCNKHRSQPYIFGKTIEPPAGMNVVRPGMSEEQVKVKVPDLERGVDGLEGLPIKVTAREDAKVIVLYDDKHTVTSVRVVLVEKEPELVAALTRNWGSPATSGKTTTWLDEKTAWRAEVTCQPIQCQVDFTTYRPFTAAIFGKHPGPISGIVADAKGNARAADAATAGFLPDVDMVEWFDGVKGRLASKDGVIDTVIVFLPDSGPDMLVKAWGPAVLYEMTGKQQQVWHHPETHWRAQLEKDSTYGYAYTLRMTRYTPYVEALGPGPEIAWAPSSLLSKTGTELAKENPTTMKIDTATGTDALVKLVLPPTDWELAFTQGSIWVPKFPASEPSPVLGARSIWMNFAYGPRKDEMFRAFKKKWGEPKELPPDPAKPGPKFLFHESNPRIVVEHHADYTPAWRIWVRVEEDKPKKP